MSFIFKAGWHRDLPDLRDYTPETDSVADMLSAAPTYSADLPPQSADLREWCSPVEDQRSLGSCTANAATGALEYLQRKFFNSYVDMSRLFVYKNTRKLMGVQGDTGAGIRDTIKSLSLFGAPPEQYWPYNVDSYDLEPTQFVYAMAQSYKAIKYFKVDHEVATPQNVNETILEIKRQLAAGFPLVFGFMVYQSMPSPGTKKVDIPLPSRGDYPKGGHAVMACGYDDNREMPTTIPGRTVKGAFLIRNSWGSSWGDGGYGWLPYAYVNARQALDWWAITCADYTDLSKF